MPRTFNRQRFLFPQNLRENRFRTAARPTDAFTRASQGTVIQAPNTQPAIQRPDTNNSLLSLARSLGVASDNVGQQVARQAQEFNSIAEAEGKALAARESLDGNKQNFNQVIQRTRRDEGEDRARELMKLNPHFQRGYDEAYSRQSALDFNRELQQWYQENPVVSGDEESGNELRLFDLGVADDRYQDALQQFSSSFIVERGLDSIDPKASELFTPALQDATSRVNSEHYERQQQAKIDRFEAQSTALVTTTAADIQLDEEYQTGDVEPLLDLAAVVTQQLDEAHDLGYGGDELKRYQSRLVAQLIDTAVSSSDARLLEALQHIEVGSPNSRSKLIDTDPSLSSAITRARNTITDQERADWRYENIVEDREIEEASRTISERTALAAEVFQRLGGYSNTQAIEAYEEEMSEIRELAVDSGNLAFYNSQAPNIRQNAVDNTRNTIVDYEAVGVLEAQVIGGGISSDEALRQLNDMNARGVFGTGAQSADILTNLTTRIRALDDKTYAQYSSRVDRASAAYSSVIEQRYGYEVSEQGELTSVRDELLLAHGMSDEALATVAGGGPEVDAWLTQASGSGLYTQTQIQYLRGVANGQYKIFDVDGQPFDSAVVVEEVNAFKAGGFRAIQEEEERLGRPLTQQEQDELISSFTSSELEQQRNNLSPSNPLSSQRAPRAGFEQDEAGRLSDTVFRNLESVDGDYTSEVLLDEAQVFEAISYEMQTGTHHPAILDLSRKCVFA